MLHLIPMVAKKRVSTKYTWKETRREWKHVTTKKNQWNAKEDSKRRTQGKNGWRLTKW